MIKTTPKDFFLHLAVIVTLYTSTIGLLRLLFQIINTALPDQLSPYIDPYSTEIRWWIAALIIVFPLYLLISWLLERDYARVPEKRELGIRRWLVYLTLFIAGIALVVDLVVLLNTFLGGEITTRFILKVLSVLVVAGAVFGYYLYDLRRQLTTNHSRLKLFAIIAAVAVLASIVGGFIFMGSPTTQRYYRLDQTRVNNLTDLQYQILNYWQSKNKLPADLAALADPLTGQIIPRDPETGESYEYQATGPLAFQLCATFRRESSADINKSQGRLTVPYPGGLYDFTQDNWQHPAGHFCFPRTIDPDKYPPNKTVPKV